MTYAIIAGTATFWLLTLFYIKSRRVAIKPEPCKEDEHDWEILGRYSQKLASGGYRLHIHHYMHNLLPRGWDKYNDDSYLPSTALTDRICIKCGKPELEITDYIASRIKKKLENSNRTQKAKSLLRKIPRKG